MFEGYAIFLIALGYLSLLFAVAWVGDHYARSLIPTGGRPMIYALSIAIYCTTWTYLGSVGTAATTGWGFIPVYLGPVLMFLIGWPILLRVVRIAKSQNITSITDFMAARYGKSPSVAAVVTCVAVVGTVPYIALQIKAIQFMVETLQSGTNLITSSEIPTGYDDTLGTGGAIAAVLALFAILFGTRHADATEHQFGLTMAIAAESVVKLAAFVIVGVCIVTVAFSGPLDLFDQVVGSEGVYQVFSQPQDGSYWLTVTFLASCCVLLLPRQFHVIVVENSSEFEVRRASWLFPGYLFAINIFVVPIAAAGLLLLPSGVDPDLYVILLPMAAEMNAVTVIAFIGGLSAASAMVIMESIAVAILICNGLVVPFLLRNPAVSGQGEGGAAIDLLMIRRIAIAGIILAALIVEQMLADAAGLSAIGLIAFAAIAQLAPAFFIGLFWRGATARGAIAGISAGALLWGYTLLLPWIVKAGWLPSTIVADGPLGLGFLKPQALFYLAFDPLSHGVFWSMLTNILVLVLVSNQRRPEMVERMQSQVFSGTTDMAMMSRPADFKIWRSVVTVGDLKQTVARYLGGERAERSFSDYAATRGRRALPDSAKADVQTLRFTEHLLASAIGPASSRLVLSLLLRRDDVASQATTLRLLDDASEALQHNRDLLQSAIDQVRHGLVVFDHNMRLVCWNRRFRELLELPQSCGRVGVPLTQVLRIMAERGDFGDGDTDELISDRLTRLAVTRETFQEKLASSGRYIEIRTARMPQGGIVTTFADITQRVRVANALAEMNVSLERRVQERTAELLSLNAALAVSKARADSANQDKTRFLAAATHDILQPLNAARLYATSLAERPTDDETQRLAHNVDVSLRAVEEIFGAIMEISRIDAGRLEPDFTAFAVADVFDALQIEFEPIAKERGIDLRFVPSKLWVRSDKRLLRRLLQNLVSNAIKYTERGRVLIGVRRRGGMVRFVIADTGPGIAEEHQQLIYREFQRIDGRTGNARGLGLGLSIVDRISQLLTTEVSLESVVGRGSVFSVDVPRTDAAAANDVTKPAAVKSPLDGIVVVCIDNEPAILEGMKTLLGNWGCTVIGATSAEEAIDQLDSDEPAPDVIFADYHLDRGTGDEAIASIRNHVAFEVPGVIITADHSQEREKAVREAGLSLLRKPIKAGSVRAILSKYARIRAAAE